MGGLALAAMGSDTRVHPVPDATATLRTNGIYAWIRHPMYAAVLLACLGVVLSTGRVLSVVAFGALVVVLRAKARFEDRMLGEKFGAPYADYAARVPGVDPRRAPITQTLSTPRWASRTALAAGSRCGVDQFRAGRGAHLLGGSRPGRTRAARARPRSRRSLPGR